MEAYRPYELIPANKKLPSDSTFREDIIYMKLKEEGMA